MKVYMFAFFLLLCVLGCNNQSDKKWVNPLVCDFNKEDGTITRHPKHSYDIMAVPVILDMLAPDKRGKSYKNVPLPHGVDLFFFNYGGDIRILGNAIEDIFISGSTYCYYYAIDVEHINIDVTHDNEIYGIWATASVFTEKFLENDVFISPLAYRFMMMEKDERERDGRHLICVRMIEPSENKYFNGVFVGDFTTYSYVNERPDLVEYYHSARLTGGNSKLWKPM